MDRRAFIRMCGLLGVAIPSMHLLSGCEEDGDGPKFEGKILIIGAGAGGLAAAYRLNQLGIDFEVLEASAEFGGRMRVNDSFADFPVPLGSEWIETGTGIFREIVNDSAVSVDIETFSDDPDRKFVNYSWFSFFRDYIVPSVASRIRYRAIVNSINYASDGVVVTTTTGESFSADRIIVSAPLAVLRDGDIQFTPPLPTGKREAMNELTIWEGFKAFFEFSEAFYEPGAGIPYADIDPQAGQKLFYDAAYGQRSSRNIVGLFAVGEPARAYISRTGNSLKDFILGELDALTDGEASRTYVSHITQNWNAEPFIKGGYISDESDYRTVAKLGTPVNGKVYFGGGAYTDGEDWVSVHAAARSGVLAARSVAFS